MLVMPQRKGAQVPTTTEMTLPETLRAKRGELGWTLEEAGKHAGLNDDNLGMIERGIRRPRVTTLQRLASAYGIPFEELVRLQDVPGGKVKARLHGGLLGRRDVQDWLKKEDADLLLRNDEEYMFQVAELEDLDEFEKFLIHLEAEKARILDALRFGDGRKLFSPAEMVKSVSALSRQIRGEYRARERAAIATNNRLWVEGKSEGLLSRGEMPSFVLHELRKARKREQREMLARA
jgi:transcriptional regulator with XRE-family HTH domain